MHGELGTRSRIPTHCYALYYVSQIASKVEKCFEKVTTVKLLAVTEIFLAWDVRENKHLESMHVKGLQTGARKSHGWWYIYIVFSQPKWTHFYYVSFWVMHSPTFFFFAWTSQGSRRLDFPFYLCLLSKQAIFQFTWWCSFSSYSSENATFSLTHNFSVSLYGNTISK